MLVFVPLSASELAEWAGGAPRDVSGFAATPAFLDSFEVSGPDSEDADLTLLEIAGVSGLLAHGQRLVAVCEADAEGVEPAEFGSVTAPRVPWASVESLFCDDAAGRERASEARAALSGLLLDEAWDADAAHDLLRGTELLWHGSSEWERLV